MPDLGSWNLLNFNIGFTVTCALQTWSTVHLKIYDTILLGYPGNPCYLPLMNYIASTLKLTALHVVKRPGPSCWGSSYACGTCMPGIWRSYYTLITTGDSWPYIFLYYVLFNNTHTYNRCIPLGVVWTSWSGKLWLFIVHTARCIYLPMKIYAWDHESYWCLFPWVFISRCSSC